MSNLATRAAAIISQDDLDINPVQRTKVSDNALEVILPIVFGVFATIAVLMVTIGALKMVMSRGNPQEVAKAQETVIYAAVGLVISIAAYAIIGFVINNI